MTIVDRVARLEQRTALRTRSVADRLADALIEARRRCEAMTAEERKAMERASHKAALAAMPPSDRASELARRLYEARIRLARAYFERSGREGAEQEFGSVPPVRQSGTR